jgi:hypothetical protein
MRKTVHPEREPEGLKSKDRGRESQRKKKTACLIALKQALTMEAETGIGRHPNISGCSTR